jgi:hypothetical protein
MLLKPNVFTLKSCDFCMVESYAGGRPVLLLPSEILRMVVQLNAHLIRIPSLTLAAQLPNFGSEASGEYSFLPHQDNFGDPNDPKLYLMLSIATPGARGAKTLVCLPEHALLMLAVEEAFFRKERIQLGRERAYNPKFQLSESQYHRCFDDLNGYEEVVHEVYVLFQGRIPESTIRLNILNYLIRGPSVEPLMQELMRLFGHLCVEESWEDGGVIIIVNLKVFHMRFGGNPVPPNRIFCI